MEYEVDSFNQVTKERVIRPSYKQDLSRKRVITFTYLTGDQVILHESMDGQFPYWVSITPVKDIEMNTKILNRILFDDFSVFAGTWPELYKKKLNCYQRSFYINDGKIRTPFEYGLASEPGEIVYWGKFIAEGINEHHIQMKELCKYREADGKYLEILKNYLTIFESD